MKVLWMPLALSQVEEIVDYIARDKPGAAIRWADGAFDLAATLREAPRQGRVVPETRREEIRELLYGNYRIIYKLTEEAILILTVRHGRRLLSPSDLGQV